MEIRRRKEKENIRTELDKLPYSPPLPQSIEFTRNSVFPTHAKMQLFHQIIQISEIEELEDLQ